MGSWRGSSTNGEMLVLLDPNRNVLTCRSKQKGKDLYVRKFPTNEKDKKKESILFNKLESYSVNDNRM